MNCIHMVGKGARGARDSGNMGFLVNIVHWTHTVNSIRFSPLPLLLFLSFSIFLSLSILGFATRISLPDDIIFERVSEKFASFVEVYCTLSKSLARDGRIMERKGSSITIKSSIFIISGCTGITGIRKKEKICGRGVEG